MRAVNAIRRTLMLLLLVPVVAICLDTLLRAFDAQEGNLIVDTVRAVADTFIFDTFRTVFPDQSYVQTAVVALAGWGIITLIVVAVFRGIRSAVAARPPRPAQSARSAQSESREDAPRTAAASPDPTPSED